MAFKKESSEAVNFHLVGKSYDDFRRKEVVYTVGIAIDHVNGRLTNEKLASMSYDELFRLAYSPDMSSVNMEVFQYPESAKWREKNDSADGGTYEGAHRAVTYLAYRMAVDAKERIAKGVRYEARPWRCKYNKMHENDCNCFREATGKIKTIQDYQAARQRLLGNAV